jgi:hypothetical protein
MADQKASGLSHKRWCETKGLGLSTYEYRCRRVRKALEKCINGKQAGEIVFPVHKKLAEPVFAKVNIDTSHSGATGMSIMINSASISIAPDTPEEHIRIVLEVIAGA